MITGTVTLRLIIKHFENVCSSIHMDRSLDNYILHNETLSTVQYYVPHANTNKYFFDQFFGEEK